MNDIKSRVWWFCLLCSVWWLASCARAPAEARLREQVSAMQEAVSERDTRSFMQGVAEDFAGNRGIDRAALQQMLRAQMLANSGIRIATGPMDVRIDGENARVKFQAVFSGGNGRFALDRASAWEIDSAWREEGGKWRVYYAQWEQKL